MDLTLLYRLFLEHPSVRTDTRTLEPGDLFFALRGPSFNGNAFALNALEAGAAYAVVDDPALAGNDRCVVVNDVLQTLQDLARHHRRQVSLPVLAITGSNGKTTTKELVTATLRQRWNVLATTGNLNNHIGVPLTLLRLRADHDLAVVEMGANHQGEIASYCTIAEPTHGLITNVGKAHIEGFGGEEGVRKGKGELYDFLRRTGGTVFRNADLDYLASMASGITNQVLYGTGEGVAVRGRLMQAADTLAFSVETGGDQRIIQTRLVGDYNLPNALAAVAVGTQFGVAPAAIGEALEAYQPDNSRSQWLQRGDVRIVLDAYNANPTSMRAALENFAKLDAPHKQVWLGGMKEMGPAEGEEHRSLVQFLESWPWAGVLLVGQEFEPVRGAHRWFATAEEALSWLQANRPPAGATILLKGSRGSRMETLLQVLPAATESHGA